MKEMKAILKVLGSLWFATTLMLALMLAMGSATIFETARGAEQTKALFYLSPWFKGLEWLLAINILAALLLRLPFKKKLIPFYLAHLGILVTLFGALITEKKGIDGTLSIAVGSKEDQFLLNDDTIALTNLNDKTDVQTSIRPYLGSRLKKVTVPEKAEVSMGDVHVRVLRYWPDMQMEQRFANDGEEEQAAVNVSIGDSKEVWVLAGRPQFAGRMHASVVPYSDEEAWQKAVDALGAETQGAKITATLNEAEHSVALAAASKAPVAVGDTDYAFKVLRYLPHAGFAADGSVVNSSNQPINPAVEVQITKGDTTVRRLLFANYPNFEATTNDPGLKELKLVFNSGQSTVSHAPLEFHVAPSGKTVVRMAPKGGTPVVTAAEQGKTIDTPWGESKLTLHKVYDHARKYMEPIMPDPIRKNRQPAVEVELTTPEGTKKQWIGKYSEHRFARPKGTYQLVYRDKLEEFGFNVILKDFQIGHYPGGTRPRTYQSTVIFENPETGVQENILIGMNKPGKYGGYTFYQSSYDKSRKPVVSVLSVAKDPGLPIVFFGYFLLTGGMLVVIIVGMLKAKRKTVNEPDSESVQETEKGVDA